MSRVAVRSHKSKQKKIGWPVMSVARLETGDKIMPQNGGQARDFVISLKLTWSL